MWLFFVRPAATDGRYGGHTWQFRAYTKVLCILHSLVTRLQLLGLADWTTGPAVSRPPKARATRGKWWTRGGRADKMLAHTEAALTTCLKTVNVAARKFDHQGHKAGSVSLLLQEYCRVSDQDLAAASDHERGYSCTEIELPMEIPGQIG